MEQRGFIFRWEGFGWTNVINYAFHWDGYGDDHKSTGKKITPAGIRDGFHTFAMEWYPQLYSDLPIITIWNLAGQMVRSYKAVQNISTLLLDDLSEGVYCLSIRHDEALEYLKFIKE